jgi:hypothetical protein
MTTFESSFTFQATRQAHVVRAEPARQHQQTRGEISRQSGAQRHSENSGQPTLTTIMYSFIKINILQIPETEIPKE